LRSASLLLCSGLLLLLSGCGTLGGVSGGNKPEPAGQAQPPAKQASAAPDEVPKKGGYYLDDGPGDHPPPNIDAIPDAVPRVEPTLARANRPYMALGENYTPMTEYQPYKASGVASWYGRRYHGQKTSSGELYDMYGMTAAHPTLPIPSYARITNLENGRAVVVRINDRGPFKKDRLVDLSYAAAYKLRLTGKGSGMVELEAINPRGLSPATGSTFLQIGAFKMKENADLLREKLKQQNLAQEAGQEKVEIESWYNDDFYRVRMGPYPSRDDAERAAGRVRQTLGLPAVVISQ